MSYTTFEVVKKMGIRQERLREWIDRGFIIPSIQKAQGRGTKNIFSRDDLYKLGLFQYLLSISLSRKRAAEIVKYLYLSQPYLSFEPGTVVINLREEGLTMPYLDGKMTFDSIRIEPKGEAIELSFKGDFDEIDSYVVINFSKIKRRVDTAFPE